MHYSNETEDAEEGSADDEEGSAEPNTEIKTGSIGLNAKWGWITLTIVLIVGVCLLALLILMPRIGLYTVLFNFQNVPPKVTV